MDDWLTAVRELLARPGLRALTLVVGAVVVARIVDWFICSTLRRLAQRSKTQLDDRLIDLLHRPIFLSVVLFGLFLANVQLAFGPPYTGLVGGLIKSLAVIIWISTLLRISNAAYGSARHVSWFDARTIPLFENVTKIVLIGGAVYGLLSVWQLDVTPWLASAGIAGLALGFAAKDSLGNIFGGLSIIADAPYKVGDFVNLDQGERGMVTQIGLRSTRILTRDDIEVTVPNSVIANSKIINESGGHWERSRLRVDVGVAYGSDVDRVREVLMHAAMETEHVLKDPEPRIRFSQMGDSALIFQVMCWIEEPVLRGRAVDALNTSIYKALKASKIEIPFPQRDIHIRSGLPQGQSAPSGGSLA